MKCCICGKEIPQRKNRRGRPSKYCSQSCRKAAQRLRNKIGAVPPEPRYGKTTVRVTVSPDVDADIDEQTFERMRDGRILDELRFNRDVLHKALADAGTSPTALASISKQLIDVCKQIEDLEADGGDVLPASEELNDDAILTDLI
ncbi:MAG: hypothetical protein U0N15_04255 [Bifidobacterium choerinum]